MTICTDHSDEQWKHYGTKRTYSAASIAL